MIIEWKRISQSVIVKKNRQLQVFLPIKKYIPFRYTPAISATVPFGKKKTRWRFNKRPVQYWAFLTFFSRWSVIFYIDPSSPDPRIFEWDPRRAPTQILSRRDCSARDYPQVPLPRPARLHSAHARRRHHCTRSFDNKISKHVHRTRQLRMYYYCRYVIDPL